MSPLEERTLQQIEEQIAERYGASVTCPLRNQGPDVYAVGGWDGSGLVGDVLRVAGGSARAATAVEATTLRLVARDTAAEQ